VSAEHRWILSGTSGIWSESSRDLIWFTFHKGLGASGILVRVSMPEQRGFPMVDRNKWVCPTEVNNDSIYSRQPLGSDRKRPVCLHNADRR